MTGLIVFYGYMMEAFFAWYSANEFEKYMIYNRMTGPYWYMYWTLIFCNGLVPQLLWIKKIRLNVGILFVISIIVNIGMWLERYVIIVTSLHRDFLPSSWGMYQGTPLRLVLLHRHDGPVPDALLPVHPGAADDRHLRDAHAAARRRQREQEDAHVGAQRGRPWLTLLSTA